MSVRRRRDVAQRIRASDRGRKQGRAPSQIGDHNLRVTLEAIRRDGPLTRLELASRTGLTGPGITNILRRLADGGLVTARKRVEKGGGQSPTEFALHPDGAFSIGIRLRESDGEAVLLNLSGEVCERIFFETSSTPAAAIANVALSMTATRGVSARMLGIGVACEDPGAQDLGGLAETSLSPKVFVERDCVTALLAERTLGVGQVEGGFMLIIVGERVRAGFLLRGAPFVGVHSRAGSIGLMRTGADHVPLDSVAGLKAFRETLNATERLQLMADADVPVSAAIRDWIRDAAGHLVDAIVATAGFLAPGAILIGGDLPANILEELIAQISVERRNTAVRPVVTPWISPISRTTFTGAGIAIGAALLPFFDQLLPSPMSQTT